ncbi:MAG: holo-[acyl-carrier-protein] synthase [Nitrospirae bacterium GWC2_57_13]|jgi:holo-[acyl-carrier protein] synthase|nr:MAG: holo-[acyl-carrier-protein] synthase [Nitrospirae bacterium GWC1_57_7]OGW29553.1 MAG: holo-[acyl-carrier-protein] synthase [Nitrospirae bacterium GWC2_57_13]OGW41882.1 MAG: holo-[acyl-carrier-protein] synthase [Nitrospirae bacterium GWD2_57_8]HAS55423.1 ACP synthase [Nitrospiraceae bacterium]
MIIGIGIDLVKISRIDKAGSNNASFLERIFTERERAYCARQKYPAQHYAARFAAKEALLKAFGTGLSAGMKWTDIEVLHGEGGGPIVNIAGRVKDLADLKGVKQIMLSYSHDEGYAVAQAILVG